MMSQQNDSQNPSDSIESLKVTAAAKREHGDPVENNLPIPGWLLAVFGAVICFSGVYFGIYHGGFQGTVFNEEQSSPEILFARKGGAAVQVEAAAEQTLVELGKGIYANCQPCHQASGLGIAGQFPTLAGTDWVNGSEKRLVAILLKGLMGPLKVGDATYNGAMPAWEKALSDKKLAAVMSYVRASFGNNSPEISEAKVAAARKEFAAQVAPWTEADLLKIPADAKIDAGEGPAPAPAPGTAAAPAAAGSPAPAVAAVDIDAGKAQYLGLCGACHQPTGLGLPPVFPPLLNSEYVTGSTERLVAIVLKGVIGPITVDGKPYNNMMPPQGAVLTDSKISQITSYVRDAFGSKASPITTEEVTAVRKKYEARQASWTEAELKAFAP
jgi:mono/diheme cytochrome c family protein